MVLGVTNIDLYALCSSQVENRRLRISFECTNWSNQSIPLFRKIYCEATISVDQPILKKSNENCLYITVCSICNLEEKDGNNSQIGFMIPIGQEV